MFGGFELGQGSAAADPGPGTITAPSVTARPARESSRPGEHASRLRMRPLRIIGGETSFFIVDRLCSRPGVVVGDDPAVEQRDLAGEAGGDLALVRDHDDR